MVSWRKTMIPKEKAQEAFPGIDIFITATVVVMFHWYVSTHNLPNWVDKEMKNEVCIWYSG